MMASANSVPIPGSASSSETVAVLRSVLPGLAAGACAIDDLSVAVCEAAALAPKSATAANAIAPTLTGTMVFILTQTVPATEGSCPSSSDNNRTCALPGAPLSRCDSFHERPAQDSPDR